MVLPALAQCGQFSQQCLVERRILFHDLFRMALSTCISCVTAANTCRKVGTRPARIDALRFRRYRQARVAQGELVGMPQPGNHGRHVGIQ